MMKDALKNRMKKLVIEVELGEDGQMRVNTPQNENQEEEREETSDMAPEVKDSDEPGVEKENVQEDETQIENDILQRMPRPAPMDPNSLNARAQRGMLAKMDAKKGLKV